jgi:N-hydroxyarylamine O-acetyltransferase
MMGTFNHDQVSQYLERIQYLGIPSLDYLTLERLHQQHIYHVPFENLDIYFKRAFDLETNNIFNKVVIHHRGGFCYELNSLFNILLCTLGFESRIISARIIDEEGQLGPEFDHMSIIVKLDKEYLLDVGYGDLFVIPLEIKEGVQHDGRNSFKIEQVNANYLLSMSVDDNHFVPKYLFNYNQVSASDFTEICADKQTNSLSYFVKNTVCTKATSNGRVTLFNDKLIEKINGHKKETLIPTDLMLKDLLQEHFDIHL